MEIKDKKVLVVGSGVSGFEAARLLLSRGARVKVTEGGSGDAVVERAALLESLGARCETGGHTREFCEGQDLIVTSPGVPKSAVPLQVAAYSGVPVIGEMELGYIFCPCPIIAVTGTNGKTTVTELLGRIFMFSGRPTVICGNIGNPLCGEVDKLGPESIAIVEVSSFQLETIDSFRPFVSVLLNITEDHYDRHGDMEGYKKAKYRIFRNQDMDDHAVINSVLLNDPMTGSVVSKRHFFGKDGPDAFVDDNAVRCDYPGGEVLIRSGDVLLPGKHNLENIASCMLVAGIFKIPRNDLLTAVGSFRGLGHRFEHIGVHNGVSYIDDSKATNIDATAQALRSLSDKVVLIAGGRDKGGDYSLIADLIRSKVDVIVLIGEAAGRIEEHLGDIVEISKAADMAEAVEIASAKAAPGGTVLLSPMCSSFDMFSGYKERGEVFRRAVASATQRHNGENI